MSKRDPRDAVKRPEELSAEERGAREPVFDAFAEGVAPGGLRSKTDIKLLILYLLEQQERPVPDVAAPSSLPVAAPSPSILIGRTERRAGSE
ncbi:MAG: hypothetical protein ACSW70_04195, partial [Eubacteriales bacterium]